MTHIPHATARSLVRLILAAFAVNLMVLTYVFWQGYQGRENIVTNNRAVCKFDRFADASTTRVPKLIAQKTP